MADGGPVSIYETQLVSSIFEPLARILIERARPQPCEHVLDATQQLQEAGTRLARLLDKALGD
jgi:hypothetical protein